LFQRLLRGLLLLVSDQLANLDTLTLRCCGGSWWWSTPFANGHAWL